MEIHGGSEGRQAEVGVTEENERDMLLVPYTHGCSFPAASRTHANNNNNAIQDPVHSYKQGRHDELMQLSDSANPGSLPDIHLFRNTASPAITMDQTLDHHSCSSCLPPSPQ
ncbi:splicing factor, proline- and glutamine-rich [Sarotherodon galilaeus]